MKVSTVGPFVPGFLMLKPRYHHDIPGWSHRNFVACIERLQDSACDLEQLTFSSVKVDTQS